MLIVESMQADAVPLPGKAIWTSLSRKREVSGTESLVLALMSENADVDFIIDDYVHDDKHLSLIAQLPPVPDDLGQQIDELELPDSDLPERVQLRMRESLALLRLVPTLIEPLAGLLKVETTQVDESNWSAQAMMGLPSQFGLRQVRTAKAWVAGLAFWPAVRGGASEPILLKLADIVHLGVLSSLEILAWASNRQQVLPTSATHIDNAAMMVEAFATRLVAECVRVLGAEPLPLV